MLRKAHHIDRKDSPNPTLAAMEKLERYESVTKEVSQFLDKRTVTTILGAAFISSLFVFAFEGNSVSHSANSAVTKGHSQSIGNDHAVGSESAASHEGDSAQVKYVLEEISAESSAEGSAGSGATGEQLLDIQLLSKNSRQPHSEVRNDQSRESVASEAASDSSGASFDATATATLEAAPNSE